MVHRVLLSRQAKEFLDQANDDLSERLRAKLLLLREPYEIDHVKIRGEENLYRTRVGDYRILYVVFDDENLVIVSRIDKRSRVYKR